MKVLKAPETDLTTKEIGHYSIFLAGSIEMGKAEKWQDTFTKGFEDENVVIYNPRRDDWDSSWVQSIKNKQFNKQVTWELTHLEDADLIVVYFDPKTMSPITLMELGLHAGNNIVVCCPEGYERKGNVDIVCERYHIPQVKDLDSLIKYAKERLHEFERDSE